MEYGICWFTGTRAFQSLLLSPVLCENKASRKGLLMGGPAHSPPSPAPLQQNSGEGHKGVQSGGYGIQVPRLHITPGDHCLAGGQGV